MEQTKDKIQVIIDRWFNGQLTDSDLEQLNMLSSHTQFSEWLSGELKFQWEKIKDTGEFSSEQTKRLGQFILGEHSSFIRPAHRVHFLKTSWFRYAAAVILILGAAVYFWNTNKKTTPTLASNDKHIHPITVIAPGRDRAILTLANGEQIMLDNAQGNIVKQNGATLVNLNGKLSYEGAGTDAVYNTISTPKGGQYQIVLPDGSHVWLNAASSIKFPTVFAGNVRQVEMTGEVYMEIARNSKQSFIVNVRNGAAVQVLGTSFNVNAYADESVVKTTLIDGSVKVISSGTNNDHIQSVILKPGQQAVVSSDQQLKMVTNADIEQALAWKNGAFQLGHTNLAETMRQLARWYDIEVVYEKEVPDIKLWGKIKRDLNLSQMLDVLSGLGVKFRMEGRRLIVLQ